MSPDAAFLIARIVGDASALAKTMTEADGIVKQGAKTMQNSARSAGEGVGANLGKGLESALKTALGAAGITLGFAGLIGAGQEVFRAWEAGAQSMRIGASFREQFGVQAVEGLETLRKAARGTIDDMNLMLSANKAAMLGVSTDTKALAQLLEVATVRGRALGVGTQQAFNDIVTGIGRMSPLILDNLGIVTGGEKAFEAYAKSIGTTAAELTDAQRKQLLINKVVGEGVTVTEDALSSTERLGASWSNLRAQLGESIHAEVIIEVIAKTMGAVTTGLKQEAAAADLSGPWKDIIKARAGTDYYSQNKGANYSGVEAYEAEKRALDQLIVALQSGRISQEQFQASAAALIGTSDLATRMVLRMKGAAESLPSWTEMHIALSGSIDATAATILGATNSPELARAIAQGNALKGYDAGRFPSAGALRSQAGSDIADIAYAKTVAAARGGGGGKSKMQQAGEEAAREARSAVESILTPSTARYVGGAYQNAWDEYVRRLQSAVSDPKSMWKGLLGGRSGDSAKAFAKEEEEAFYNGMRPEMIDWAAFDAAYAHLLQVKASREALIQMAMARVGGKDKAGVMKALGLEGTPLAAGAELASGFAVGVTAANLAKPVTDQFQKELEGQQGTWVKMGTLSMTWFKTGLTEGITKATAKEIAKALFPAFYELLLAREARV